MGLNINIIQKYKIEKCLLLLKIVETTKLKANIDLIIMNTNNKHEHAPKVKDEDGITYIFGYYKNGEGWSFVPHRFHIVNEKKNKVSGEFLTSNWFSCKYYPSETAHFMILGINKSFSYLNIIKIINESIPSQIIYHKLNEAEKEVGICFKDYYMINHDKVDKIVSEINSGFSNKEINIYGYNGLSKLNLNCRVLNKKILYVTLPNFTMELNIIKHESKMCEYDK